MEDLKETRALFNTCHHVKEDCEKLLKLTKDKDMPVYKGYHATAIMISSKYVSNPFKKMPVFNAGKSDLEDVISENYDIVENHYLRYACQMVIPKILGYYKNIEEDRAILVKYIKEHVDDDFIQHMMIFFKDTKDPILNKL